MNIGERLANQRKELGKSQAAFAKLVGISLSSQKRYESGERIPDVEYLAAIAPFGINIDYVLNGGDSSGRVARDSSEAPIESIFAIPHGGLTQALAASLVNELDGGFDPFKYFFELTKVSSIFRHAADRYASLDTSLLSLILEGIEASSANAKHQLPAAKKAAVASTLYRAFKASGKIDQALIEDAVSLANS